jgi:hypothetical protein
LNEIPTRAAVAKVEIISHLHGKRVVARPGMYFQTGIERVVEMKIEKAKTDTKNKN